MLKKDVIKAEGEYDVLRDKMSYKCYRGSIEYSKEDGVYFGRVLNIKSLISYEGNTVEGLEKDFQRAVDDYLEMCEEIGITPEK